MKTWYMNLTAKQFKNIFGTLLVVPPLISVSLSLLQIWSIYTGYVTLYILPAYCFYLVRRYTHPSEFSEFRWGVFIFQIILILITVGIKISFEQDSGLFPFK
jgi:hypothetical protein